MVYIIHLTLRNLALRPTRRKLIHFSSLYLCKVLYKHCLYILEPRSCSVCEVHHAVGVEDLTEFLGCCK
jgi:hypothetical protein